MAFLKRFGYLLITGILVSLTLSFIVGIVSYYFRINIGGSGYAGLFVLCLIYGLGGAFISLQISRWMAKKFHGVDVINPQTMNPTERKLVDTVYRLARNAGLETMPEVGYYESGEVNAFATGPSRSRSLVAVSTGLLNTMTESEIEGVLAHEITHITNGDMVTLTLISGVVNSFAMFISWIITTAIMNALRRNDDDRRGFGDWMLRSFIHNMVSMIFMTLGMLIVNYFSRAREFRADAGGARYSSPEKMTSALMRLQRVTSSSIGTDNNEKGKDDGLATMKISGKTTGFSRLFMTHPPLEERIEALRNRTYQQN